MSRGEWRGAYCQKRGNGDANKRRKGEGTARWIYMGDGLEELGVVVTQGPELSKESVRARSNAIRQNSQLSAESNQPDEAGASSSFWISWRSPLHCSISLAAPRFSKAMAARRASDFASSSLCCSYQMLACSRATYAG